MAKKNFFLLILIVTSFDHYIKLHKYVVFKDRKTLMSKRCRPRKKIDLVTCTHNQKGKYELDIVNSEKKICESHRAEKNKR